PKSERQCLVPQTTSSRYQAPGGVQVSFRRLLQLMRIKTYFPLFQELNDQGNDQTNDGQGVHEGHSQDHQSTDLTQGFRVAAGSLYGAQAHQTQTNATTGGGNSVGQTKC